MLQQAAADMGACAAVACKGSGDADAQQPLGEIEGCCEIRKDAACPPQVGDRRPVERAAMPCQQILNVDLIAQAELAGGILQILQLAMQAAIDKAMSGVAKRNARWSAHWSTLGRGDDLVRCQQMALPAEVAMQLDADAIARPAERNMMEVPAIDRWIDDRAKARGFDCGKPGIPACRRYGEIDIRKPALADPIFRRFQQPVRALQKNETGARLFEYGCDVERLAAHGAILFSIGLVNEAEIVAEILWGTGGPASPLKGKVEIGDDALAIGLFDEGDPVGFGTQGHGGLV